MKHLIFLLACLFTISTVSADTFNIIVSGKPGGTFHTRAMLMHDFLVEQGHNVNLINGGNIAKSEQLYKTIDKPVIMPWMDSANVNKADIEPNDKTFGILEYKAPILFCSTKYKSFDNDLLTIGYSASWPKTIFDELEDSLGKTVKSIPYQNSGDLVLALSADEVDYISTSLTKLKKLPKQSCFAVTSPTSVQEILPLSSLVKDYRFENISQHAYWLIKNYPNPYDVRSVLQQAVASNEYNSWLSNLGIVQTTADFTQDLNNSVQGAYDWGRK